MKKTFELSNGTIQVVIDGHISTYNSFEDICAEDYMNTEYFQLTDIKPALYRDYLDGKDLLMFQNGRRELIKDIDQTVYKGKYIESFFNETEIEDKRVLELVSFTDGRKDWMNGLEADAISTFKIEKRETLFA